MHQNDSESLLPIQNVSNSTANSVWKCRAMYIIVIFSVIVIGLIPLAGFGIHYIAQHYNSKASGYDNGEQRFPLKFDTNGKFKILQLTDLHYGDSGWDADANTTKAIRKTISMANPDLIMVTGDAISGFVWSDPKKRKGCLLDPVDPVKRCWQDIGAALESAGKPWGFVFGNHDRQTNYDTQMHLDMLRKFPHYVIDQIQAYYHLKIDSRFANVRSYSVIGLDSHWEGCYGVHGWGCIDFEQIQWYESEMDKIKTHEGVLRKSVAYMHIPFDEYLKVWNYFPVNGSKRCDTGCGALNTGMMSAMIKKGSTETVWCGHDHNNDYFGGYLENKGVYDKYSVTVGYGRKTGYGCYGSQPKGGRVIELHEGSTVGDVRWNTYLVADDGSYDYQQTTHMPDSKDPQNQLTCNAAPA